MFIHAVLFEVEPKEVRDYRKDSKWKTEAGHERFMNKLHDWLVSKSQAKVEVLGYYNLKAIDVV